MAANIPQQQCQVIDGNQATTHVAYALSEFAFIFPITPSSPMAELADLWAGESKPNAWGNPVTVTQMQSEAGAAAALHGAGASGGLCVTFTSSQGLLLMIPSMYKLAGELIPCVIHVATRQVGGHATSIMGDQQDIMAIRPTGFPILSSHSPQECMDLALVAHLSSLKSSVPFIHGFEGFQTSHMQSKISLISLEDIQKLIPHHHLQRHRERSLNPLHPVQRGSVHGRDVCFQSTEAQNPVWEAVPDVVEEVMREVEAVTGRHYDLFSYSGAADAKHVVVIMGAGSVVVQEVVQHLNDLGESAGVVKVHLFRPWSTRHFLAALPRSAKVLSVMDRCREPMSIGEPVFMDVATSLFLGDRSVSLIGGRYAISDRDFTPAMVKAVFDNMKLDQPKKTFVVGITDDVMYRSLDVGPPIETLSADTSQCIFWGMGGDGTVGANQLVLRLIGKSTPLFCQGSFMYDVHKSNGITLSHLRFGTLPLCSPYPVTKADYVAVHHYSFLLKFPVLKEIADHGCAVFNTSWNFEQLDSNIPNDLKRTISSRKVRLFCIDAHKIAKEYGLGKHINMIMQTVFFKLSTGSLAEELSFEKALELMVSELTRQYCKAGPAVIEKNQKAVLDAAKHLIPVQYPEKWGIEVVQDEQTASAPTIGGGDVFLREVKSLLQEMRGSEIPVSKFSPGGAAPMSATRVDKRGISPVIPVWDSSCCIQCNRCSVVCPHAAVRPFLLTADEVKDLNVLPAKGIRDAEKYKYLIQVSPLDCVGCNLCCLTCPKDALTMQSIDNHRSQISNWEYCFSLPNRGHLAKKKTTLVGSQLQVPLFEFPSACAGCGETPYLKLITQLFGERCMFACSSGCNVAVAFVYGMNPYCTNSDGRGPATAHSLFEDTAEFTLGSTFSDAVRRNNLAELIKASLENSIGVISQPLRTALQLWIDNRFDPDEAEKQRQCLMPLLKEERTNDSSLQKIFLQADLFPKISHWAIGGDGWAYDIGFAGLDHVLALGTDMNILVLDTEVFSNTGGQKSKATQMGAVHKFGAMGKEYHKKDMGLFAMSYGNAYVASIALYANPSQAVQAISEAEAYPGTSLILAYAPCIEHGITGIDWLKQTEAAVKCGYWPLYRYNPSLKKQGQNPFQLDSQVISEELIFEFLERENRFLRLSREHPERSKMLKEELKEEILRRHTDHLRRSACKKGES